MRRAVRQVGATIRRIRLSPPVKLALGILLCAGLPVVLLTSHSRAEALVQIPFFAIGLRFLYEAVTALRR